MYTIIYDILCYKMISACICSYYNIIRSIPRFCFGRTASKYQINVCNVHLHFDSWEMLQLHYILFEAHMYAYISFWMKITLLETFYEVLNTNIVSQSVRFFFIIPIYSQNLTVWMRGGMCCEFIDIIQIFFLIYMRLFLSIA